MTRRHPLIDTLIRKRRLLGLSQGAIADRAGINRSTLSYRESDGRIAALEQIERWADALGYRLTFAPIEPEPVYWS